ncbi:hypothetical protein LSAT2_007879 [Lamellibrachia satsuma]|nr:hypothetical protein LSAT2_007879 [Lamellibrachia satsuma]
MAFFSDAFFCIHELCTRDKLTIEDVLWNTSIFRAADINDVPQKVTPVSRLFADNSLLYMKTTQDRQIVQDVLNMQQEWEKVWKMFSPNKCEILTMCPSISVS